jgi:maltooligosyltrehalose trehalohydrolase
MVARKCSRVERDMDYAFLIDDEEIPLPDPRTLFQPYGIHGPSRTVNDGAFKWSDQQFTAAPLSESVIYELHVGTFTSSGTFDSAIEHLDHLVELGIRHVEDARGGIFRLQRVGL